VLEQLHNRRLDELVGVFDDHEVVRTSLLLQQTTCGMAACNMRQTTRDR
jgi:hypothetical protein